MSKSLFTARFFEVWDKLPAKATPKIDIPRYLQLLALLSFHVFIQEKVDVAVYETHMGGRYDATNVIPSPTVTVITHIAEDHVQYLGPGIRSIAWHKAGIIKPGTLAFSSVQEPAVAEVLMQEATKQGSTIDFVDKDPDLPLEVEAQRENCSLAVVATRGWLFLKGGAGQKDERSNILEGIKRFCWPGRYQRVRQEKYEWFLDGAHNESSLPGAVKWFAGACGDRYTMVLT